MPAKTLVSLWMLIVTMCFKATGLGGTVKREDAGEKIEQMERKPERDLLIRFNADRSASMQWNFRPQQTAIRVGLEC